MSPWESNGAPIAWMPKDGLRKIEQTAEDAPSAMLVYLALARIASDERSDTFSKPIAYVAKLAGGIGRRTVERRLPDLERAGVVKIQRHALKINHTYTLENFSPAHAPQSRNDAPQSRNDASQSRNDASPNQKSKSHLVEKYRSTEGKAPRSVPERIAAENQLRILKGRLENLQSDTAEQWQRDANPALVTEKQKLRAQVTALENSLLQ